MFFALHRLAHRLQERCTQERQLPPRRRKHHRRWRRRPAVGRWVSYLNGRWRQLTRRCHPRLGVLLLAGYVHHRRRWRRSLPLWRRGPLRRALQRLRRRALRRRCRRYWQSPGSRSLRWGAPLILPLQRLLFHLGTLRRLRRRRLRNRWRRQPRMALATSFHRHPFGALPAAAAVPLLTLRGRFHRRPHRQNLPRRCPHRPGPTLVSSQEYYDVQVQPRRSFRYRPQDWLREAYMPPRYPHQRRKVGHGVGIRWWFRPEEIQAAEGRDKPRKVHAYWQLEADKLWENAAPWGTETRIFEDQLRLYRQQFHHGKPTLSRSIILGQRRPLN